MSKKNTVDAQEIGAEVRAQRRAAGWTQADLAQQAGCRRQTIVAIEAGENMEIQTLLAVLAAMGQGLMIVAAQGDSGGLTRPSGEEMRQTKMGDALAEIGRTLGLKDSDAYEVRGP